MNDLQPKELSKQIRERANAAVELATAQIESLAQSVDAVRLFVATFADMGFAPEGSVSEATHGLVTAKIEVLAYYLYPFFGVSSNTQILPWHINQCVEALNTLVTMHLMGSTFTDRAKSEANEVDDIVTLARMQAEIVRGSAYPEQTGMEISSIQGHFDSWFARVAGVSPTRAKAMLWAIIGRQEEALNSVMTDIRAKAEAARKHWRAIKKKPASQRNAAEARALEVFESDKAAGAIKGIMTLNLAASQVIPVRQSDLSNLEPPATLEEWDSLMRLIGMTIEDRSRMLTTLA